MRYAAETAVSVERSRAEIETVLHRYGADQFAYATAPEAAMIGFHMKERLVRFHVPLPNRADKRFWFTPGRGLRRSDEDAYREWEQACRQRWRALCLVVKAKLEAVDAGITTFENEFLAHIVLPDGRTVGESVRENIRLAYESGRVPQLLPGPAIGERA